MVWMELTGSESGIKKTRASLDGSVEKFVRDRPNHVFIAIPDGTRDTLEAAAKEANVQASVFPAPPTYGEAPCGDLTTDVMRHRLACRRCKVAEGRPLGPMGGRTQKKNRRANTPVSLKPSEAVEEGQTGKRGTKATRATGAKRMTKAGARKAMAKLSNPGATAPPADQEGSSIPTAELQVLSRTSLLKLMRENKEKALHAANVLDSAIVALEGIEGVDTQLAELERRREELLNQFSATIKKD